MTRCLWIKDSKVANVIEYPGEVPAKDEGYEVVPAKGYESVGDTHTAPAKIEIMAVEELTAKVVMLQKAVADLQALAGIKL